MTAETVADRRLHPRSLIAAMVRGTIGSWMLPAGAFVLFNAGSSEGWTRILRWTPAVIMLIVIAAGFTLLFTWLSWSRFRYGVGERDIVIQSGVLNKVRRSIPLSRVQDVNIEQGPLARLLGIAKVKIETGGGAQDEGLLDSISLEEAERLRQEIREAGRMAASDGPGATAEATADAPAPAAAAAEPEGEIVFDMDMGRLILQGLFSFSLFYLAAAFAVIETLGDFLVIQLWEPRTWRQMAQAASLPTIALVIVAVIVLGVVFGAGRTIVRDYGFTLWKEGRRFRCKRGLLTRSQVVIPLPRVQLARTSTTLMRRLFGFSELSLQTLGGAVVEKDSSGRQSIAPFATRDEIAHILAQAGAFRLPEGGELKRVSSRRLLKKLTPLLIPTIALIVASSFIPPVSIGLAFILFAALHTALEWRFHRYAMDGSLLFVQRGILAPKLWIAPPSSAQVIVLRRSPLQRMLGLATVVVDTAGAQALDAVTVDDLSLDRARELVDQLRAAGREPTLPA